MRRPYQGVCLFCPKEPPERRPAALAARPRDPGGGCTGTPEPELGAIRCNQTERKSTRLSTRSAPKQEARSGQGALARRHTDGPLRAALLKTTLRCEGLDPIATFCSDSLRCSKSSDCSWVLKLGPWYLVPILPVTVLRVKSIAGEYSREHCPRVYAICRPELG